MSPSRAAEPSASQSADALVRFADPTGPLGVTYEHRSRRRWLLSACTRPRLLFALEPTLGHFTAELTTKLTTAGAFPAEPTPLDPSQFVLVAAGTSVRATLTSPVSRTMVLEIHPPLVARCVDSYAGEIDPAHFERMLASSRVLPRTTWVHELAQRYLFERAVCRKRDNDATRFLETELLKELYFVAREQDASHTRTSFLAGRSPTLRRALAYLEARIFEDIDPNELAKHAGASPSSLRRAFQRELGTSPLAYVRARRLDEARVRLAHGRTSVSEVALAVGYQSIAAFSRAFRARFGVPPSTSVRGSAAPSGSVERSVDDRSND